MKLPTLLIVDDERATREGLRMALEDDFDVYLAANLAEAKEAFKIEPIDVLLTDLRLGGDSGMEVLDFALKLSPAPICLMMTAYGSVDTAVEAMRRGAWHFVTKPLNLDEVDLLLKRALRSQQLETENHELKRQLAPTLGVHQILGKSSAMQPIYECIRQVAPTRATVLVEGESGTGKELVAKAIHQHSGRPSSKLVIVNCAALSPQLLESELFGHEKGAFTGAMQRRIGRFEQADGGTIVLDEIGEIDAATQVKLLRVLSERSIERVGSNKNIEVDVRVIAATNKNLQQLVESGEFREDLYFRLNVVRIEMPPLRERKEDIMLLANSFLKEFAEENNRPFKPLSDVAQAAMLAYSWPGNVRELKTTIEHGVVMCNSSQIELANLPQFLQKQQSTPAIISSDQPSLATHSQITLEPQLDFNLHALERRTIERALQSANGNRSLAAEWLGISRRTLQRKLNVHPHSFPKSPH